MNNKNEKTAVIIIHGYAGGLYEIKSLVDFLISKGIDTIPYIINGHDKGRDSLRNQDYRIWIRLFEEKLSRLRSNFDKIYIVGFSMGGLIAINSIKKNNYDKIVFINTPVYFWNVKMIVKNIINDVRTKKQEKIKYYLKATGKAPLSYSFNFLFLLKKSKFLFNKVEKPAFICQSLYDDTVKPKSAEYIKNSVRHIAKVKYYDTNNHNILCSPIKDEICADIYSFLFS